MTEFARRLALATGLVALTLVATPVIPPASAIEGTATEVDVTLVFGGGCAGDGTILIDAGGRLIGGPHDPQWGEAVHDTPLSWEAGTTIRVTTKFSGPAAPRLRLVNTTEDVLLEVALTPWGQPLPPGGDRFVVACSGGTYLVPDSALAPFPPLPMRTIGWWLIAVAAALAFLRSRLSPRTGGRHA